MEMRIISLWTMALALVPAGVGRGQDQGKSTLDAGPLRLEVHVSARTATLFHVVDQMSQWSEFCHRQYGEYFLQRDGGYAQQDRELLAKHVAIRRARGWGQGLEQAFYTESDLETALKRGVERGFLTEEQAAVEREVLIHFAPRIEALMKRQTPVVEAFAQRLAAKQVDLREFAEKVSRFCGGSEVTVPVFLLVTPSERSIGGGYNGGRLTLEIPSGRDAYPSFLHETFHAFLDTRRAEFEKAARGVPGLDSMTLNEGVAYALSPGLLHDDKSGDPLLAEVRGDLAAKKPLTDNYTRFHRLGLALRPLLRDALADQRQTLATFLPRAVDAWRVAVELDLASGTASDRERAPQRTSWFSAGPGWRELGMVAKSRQCSLYSFNHSAEHYEKILSKSQPGAMIVLLFALDHSDKNVPEAYKDLLPMPWAQIESALQKGETVESRGKSREREIVLLAAPTESQLTELIHKTKLLVPIASAASGASPPDAG
jgi:hypothetical protein